MSDELSPRRSQRTASIPPLAPEPPPPNAASFSAPPPIVRGPDLQPVAAPAPKAPNLAPHPFTPEQAVTLTVDGATHTVRAGTNVLEAVNSRGGQIGTKLGDFCYHRGLSTPASCGQCLVQIDDDPRLQRACAVRVSAGMRVYTTRAVARSARASAVALTLRKHPLDCPICARNGSCELQRQVMQHLPLPVRFPDDAPTATNREPPLAVTAGVQLHPSRCVSCTRCVRFCDEVSRTYELVQPRLAPDSSTGTHTAVQVVDAVPSTNAYSLNLVDLCPVGALTQSSRLRVAASWQLQRTATTCPGCATGCAISLEATPTRLVRIAARWDPTVNGAWICDEGRSTLAAVQAAPAILEATVDGVSAPLSQALATVATRLRGRKVATVFSAQATNEANLALAALASRLHAERFVWSRAPGTCDNLLRDADKNANLRGAYAAAGLVTKHEAELSLELAGRAYDAVLFLDGDAELSELVRDALRGIVSVVLADHRSKLTDACAVVLPATNWVEQLGTWTNRQGRLRAIQPAQCSAGARTPRAQLLRELIVAAGGPDIGPPHALTASLARERGDADLLALVQALRGDEQQSSPVNVRSSIVSHAEPVP